jgi:hypothetical protein
MKTIPHLTPFEQAVRHNAREAMARYTSAADAARITRAVDLILAGDVTLLPNGEAEVRSQTGHGSYHVNGTCPCPDFATAEGGRCQHRYANALLTCAAATLEAAWYAIHENAQGVQSPGIAFVSHDGADWIFLPEGQAAGWHCDLPSIVLLGRVLVVEAQRAADGNLIARVCGY